MTLEVLCKCMFQVAAFRVVSMCRRNPGRAHLSDKRTIIAIGIDSVHITLSAVMVQMRSAYSTSVFWFGRDRIGNLSCRMEGRTSPPRA
jgi:hypothetical protein